MKKQIKSAFVLIITAVIVAGSQFTASAQTPRPLEVSVPFDFVAGDRQLPAGRYRISRVGANNESTLRIQSTDGRARAIVLTNSARAASKQARLTFRQYGDQHFLAGVEMPDASGARELRESKRERTARLEAAARRTEPKTIALVGRE